MFENNIQWPTKSIMVQVLWTWLIFTEYTLSYRDCLYFNNCHQMLQGILLYFPYIVASRWPMEMNIGSVDRIHIQLSGVDNIVSDRIRGR